jgi:hypothetical protein
MKGFKLLILILLLSACQTKEKKTENNYRTFFTQMPGKWLLENKTTVEKWEKDGDNYKSTVYKLLGKDSIVSERIRITEIEGEIYYEATVRGQNHEKPVLFKLTESTKDKVVFENKTHDFPQKITYQFTGQDKLTATIQGLMDAKQQKIDFKYSRIK